MTRVVVTCRCGLHEITTPERAQVIADTHRQVTGHSPVIKSYGVLSGTWPH